MLSSRVQARFALSLLLAASAFLSLPVLSFAAAALPAPVPLAPGGAADAPALLPFLPTSKPTGAAVLIVPPGPLGASGAGSESIQMARWLNERGIAGFVLRYPSANASPAATIAQAVKHLRTHAAQFKVSPKRIAALGFGPGAALAGEAAYAAPVDTPAEPSSRPDLLALIWGATVPAEIAAGAPPTFLVASTRASDNMGSSVDLWTKLRSARVHVDAHFFAQGDANAGLALDHPSLGTWPEIFYNWVRFQGLLTDEPRVPIKGMVYLDGAIIPHGYVVLTPVDFVGVGPVVARVFNSTANVPLGQFTLPAGQGPVPGRYKVDVRQNMNRWLSNSFTGGLTGGRGGNVTPEQAYFGHHRALNPTIDDQKSFTKVRPTDREDYIIEIKPDPNANMDLKIEVFSK